MGFLIIVIFVIVSIMIYFVQKVNHESEIREKIELLGGLVISVEKRTFSTGPFIMSGKGRTIYRIEYQVLYLGKRKHDSENHWNDCTEHAVSAVC
ncbi:MAG TPA: hypothetical protein VIO64_05235 [Pseudobacteroides sp.]|uniref:hypothetical protein n=1 Tax=Pseudobacteroides sp. TaxID=1968840 RepID=UPI002F95E277